MVSETAKTFVRELKGSRDDAQSHGRRPHPAGIRRIAWLAGGLALAAVVPYLVPANLGSSLGLESDDFERLRAWNAGDPIPFTRFLDFRPPTRPALAGVEGEAEMHYDDDELLASAPLPNAQGRSGERRSDDGVAIDSTFRISPDEFTGMTEFIDDPHGSMNHFYGSLLGSAKREPKAVTRIAVWSDSINGSDRVTSHLRSRLQARFGDAGKGYVVAAPGWQSQHHQDVRWRTHGGWRVNIVNRGELTPGYYGFGGVVAANRSEGSRITFGTSSEGPGSAVSNFDIYYQLFPSGGTFSVGIDGDTVTNVVTGAGQTIDGFQTLEMPAGEHEIEVSVVDGEVRLYGAVLEVDRPGVVVDGVMLIGAFTRVLRNWDEEHIQSQIRQRAPDLLVFWLGGNDSVSESIPFQPRRYVEHFSEVIGRMRAGRPEASCLVISVLDSAEEKGGSVRSRVRVPYVVSAQRDAANASRCAFFNGFRAIGGSGTMYRWYRHRPRLVSVDYRHLTIAGAQVFGSLLHRALLEGYDRWLGETGAGLHIVTEDPQL